MKHMLRRRGVIWLSISLFTVKGSQYRNLNRERTWSHELIQRPWGLLLTGLLSLLSFRTWDHWPRDMTNHDGLGPCTSIPIFVTVSIISAHMSAHSHL